MGAIQAPVSDMGASGASHAHGLAPDPGSSAGTTRFLREDATWAAPGSNILSIQVPANDTLTNSVTTQQQYATSYTIPAGMFATNKGIKVKAGFELTQPSASQPTIQFAAKAGGTIWSTGAMAAQANLAAVHVTLELIIVGGATADQVTVIPTLTPAIPGASAATQIDSTAQPVSLTWAAAHSLAFFETFSNTTNPATGRLTALVVEAIG